MTVHTTLSVLIGILLIVFAGCSAPHDNPLDPKADFYRAPVDTTRPTVISTIPTNAAIGVPISGSIVAVFSEAMDTLTITTATFALQQDATPVSGTVTYTGVTAIFSPASDLALNTAYTATITTGARDLTGNALAGDYVWHFTTHQDTAVIHPTLTSRIHSEHVSRIFPTQDTYSVIAEVLTNDQPHVDSAWVRYRTGPRVVMEDRNEIWTARFSSTYFNDYLLGSVIGQPFFFSVLDDSGNMTDGGPAYLFRVIEGVPLVISPSHDSTVSAFPLLAWQAFSANFPFTYQATVSNFDLILWSSPLLGASQLSVQVADSLPDGSYFWTISVLDSFQNSTRSKEGYFIVNGGGTP